MAKITARRYLSNRLRLDVGSYCGRSDADKKRVRPISENGDENAEAIVLEEPKVEPARPFALSLNIYKYHESKSSPFFDRMCLFNSLAAATFRPTSSTKKKPGNIIFSHHLTKTSHRLLSSTI